MNAIANLEPDAEPQGATLLAVIARAASDPACDIDKMERLMQMHERAEAKRAEAAFATDLAALQTELPSIAERGDAAGRYRFALWEDINAVIKPILSRWGFALSFRTDHSDGIAVTGVLSHRSGHSERTTIKLPADKSGNKNDVQAVASSVSYGKRYTAGLLLNLTSHGEDDDGFRAGSLQPQPQESPEVERLIRDMFAVCDNGREAFAQAWKELSKESRRLISHRMAEFEERCTRAGA